MTAEWGLLRTAALLPVLLALLADAWAARGDTGEGKPLPALKPRVVKTAFPTEDVVVASLVVEGPADGSADATDAIQSAIDAVAQAGGGVVFLPAGRYLLSSRTLLLHEGVTVRGDWAPPTTPGAAAQGTVLVITAGRGDPDGPPAIAMERGTGLREVTIWYPDQNPVRPVAYPWTIANAPSNVGDNYTLHHVTLVNSYLGIRFGPDWNELHTIRQVYGTPLRTGLFIDMCSDIGRVIDVHFGPQWWETSGLPGAPQSEADKAALRDALLSGAVGLEMGRSDWEYLFGLHVQGYCVGAAIHPSRHGATNAVMYACEFSNCRTALRLDGLNDIGLSATGCTFTASDLAVHGPPSFTTVAQFNSCELGGTPRTCALVEGPGVLSFQNCTFSGWTDAGLEAKQGTATVIGCSFDGPGTHIRLGEGLRRARLLGNSFTGQPTIINAAPRADVQIAHSPLSLAKPDLSPYASPPDPRPATDALFVVTDFGASPEAADNTAAFARALSAAAQAGGGTVYVPAGNYRLAGELIVPSGVELRGCFDVPHHTVSGGSVLMPLSGRGDENATPFIRLQGRSGLRGLTIWYPDQNILDIQPYPWAIQATGPGCWLLDVTLGNAYQGADFGTYPSTGHLIRYLAGAFLRRGLFVSKSDADGWVEDVQFNPHYMARLHPSLPAPSYPRDPFGDLIAYQQTHLEGLVFGRCAREHIKGTFLFAAFDGLAFRDDGGGCRARVLQHGTDAGSRGVVLEAAGEGGIEFINAQLVHFGPQEFAAIFAPENSTGTFRLFNSQMWAGPRTAVLRGAAEVMLQQFNTLTGPVSIEGGRCEVVNGLFARDLRPHVTVGEACQGARLLANVSAQGVFRVVNHAGERLWARANSLSLRPPVARAEFRTGFEPGEPQGLADTIADDGGGIRAVSNPACRPTDAAAHSGRFALSISGHADDPAYAYAYFRAFDEPFFIYPDTVLSYWFRPLNDRGRRAAMDLLFEDGSTLRDSGAKDTAGLPVHPETPRGTVGQWTQITVPLGAVKAGHVIRAIMFAYDERNGGGGDFEALFDDLSIESATATAASVEVAVTPLGGQVPQGTRVVIAAPQGLFVRYTLDGTPPSESSPRYQEPIPLDRQGLWDLRYALEAPDGTVSPQVFGELYDVAAGR